MYLSRLGAFHGIYSSLGHLLWGLDPCRSDTPFCGLILAIAPFILWHFMHLLFVIQPSGYITAQSSPSTVSKSLLINHPKQSVHPLSSQSLRGWQGNLGPPSTSCSHRGPSKSAAQVCSILNVAAVSLSFFLHPLSLDFLPSFLP